MDTKDFLQPIQGGEQQSTVDSIIEERIKEEMQRFQQEIHDYEEKIRYTELFIPKLTVFHRFQKQDPGLKIKKDIEEWKLKIANLRVYLENAPERVARQIANNRRSEHRYNIDYFFDHSVKAGDLNTLRDKYPYDEVMRSYSPSTYYHYRINESDRTYADSSHAFDRIRQAYYKNKPLTLYDTSNPHLQMKHESLIDLLVILGFARNDEGMRSIDAIRADTGADPHALDKYDGPLLRPACSLIQEPTLYRVGDGVASSLVIEGNRDYNPRSRAAEARPGVNAALSQLCKEWDISALVGSLTYTRTSKDTIITVQLAKPEDIIDAGPVTRLPVV